MNGEGDEKEEVPSRPSRTVSEQSEYPQQNQDSLNQPSTHSFQTRPQASEKFRPSAVQGLLDSVLSDILAGKKYTTESAETWTKTIANTVRNRIKEKGFQRYKIMVQVVLGEKHGAGVKVGARCLWDADTDDLVSASYANDTIFCVVAVFAVYMY